MGNDIRCKNCGTILEEGQRFCGNCGVCVEMDDKTVVLFPSEETTPTQKNKKNTRKYVIIGIAVIVAIVLLLSYNNSKDDDIDELLADINEFNESLQDDAYNPYAYDEESLIVYQYGVARVWQIKNDKYLYGFINEAGDVIIPCIYEGTSNDIYEGKYIVVIKDGKYGVVTIDGTTVIGCKYEYIYIKDGKAHLTQNGENIEMDLGVNNE